MESDWPLTKLDDFVDIKTGNPFKSKNYSENEGIRLLRGDNIIQGQFRWANVKYWPENLLGDKENNYLLSNGDVILAMDRPWIEAGLKTAQINDSDLPCLLVQRTACLRAKSPDDQDYLRYLISSYSFVQYVKLVQTGTAVPHISPKQIKDFEFKKPPQKDRILIGKMMRSLDSKIHLNQQTNQTLEKMAQTLFKSWFVDFDPVFDNALAKADFNLDNLPSAWPAALVQRATSRLQVLQDNPTLKAKLTQHNQTETENNTALAQASQAENAHQHFPSEFEPTDEPSLGINGWIPEGWELSNTDNEFQIKGGSTPSTKNPDFWDDGEIYWTSPKDLSGNNTKIMLDTSRKITEAGLAKIISGLLPIDTVLMSSRAPVGYLALAKVPVAINQGYIAITDAKTLSSEYTIQWLDSVMDEIKSISGGTTFAEISKKTFKSIQIIIPQKGAVDAYTQIAKANYQCITANIQEIKTLTETRDYLLPKLISGEINVCGIEHE